MCSSTNNTGEEQKEGEENGSAVAKDIFSSVHVNESYGRTTEINKEPKIFFSPREIRGGRMTIPVSAGRRQRLWTPSSSHGRDAAKRPLGKLSEHQDSRERSQSFWFPTIWQQLEAKDSFRQRGLTCTCSLHHKRYFKALAPHSRYSKRLVPGWLHC